MPEQNQPTAGESAPSSGPATTRALGFVGSLRALGPVSGGFLAVVLAAQVALFWGFAEIPNQDGPAHLYNAWLMRAFDGPLSESLGVYYERHPGFVATIAVHKVLEVGGALLGYDVIMRLVLTVASLGVPLAALWVLGAFGRGAVRNWPVVAPFGLNAFLHLGFFGFSLGVVGLLALWGWLLRRGGRSGPGETALVAVLMVLLFYLHPVVAVVAGFVMGWLVVGEIIPRWRDGANWIERCQLRRFGTVALASLPAAALTVWGVVASGASEMTFRNRVDGATFLVQQRGLVSFHDVEVWFATAYAWALVATGFLAMLGRWRSGRGRDIERADGLLLAGVALIGLLLLVPDKIGTGEVIHLRLSLLPVLLLALWVVGRPGRALWGRVAAVAGGIAWAGMFASHTVAFAKTQDLLAEYDSAAAHLREGETFLPIIADKDGPFDFVRIGIFSHRATIASREARAVDLMNYEAWQGTFPMRYHDEVNPLFHIAPGRGAFAELPAAMRFDDYHERTPGRVDAVLLWMFDDGAWDTPAGRGIRAQLDASYRRAWVSEHGNAILYRRDGLGETQTETEP